MFAKRREWPRMNTDKKNPKNCFWFYPCSSVFIRGHSCVCLFRQCGPLAGDSFTASQPAVSRSRRYPGGASIGTSASRLSLSRFEAHFNLGTHFDGVAALDRGLITEL